jgi:uncharacterized protein (TIGR02145 family)
MIGLALFTCKSKSQTVTDYDGNVYDTISIGDQVWFKENLKTTHYTNGLSIPNVTGTSAWAGLSTGARCYYNNDSAAYDSIYGPLYNWYAVNSNNNICPSGWHVSTNAEWLAVESYLGGASIAGGKMKEAGTFHWVNPNAGASNSSGFTGLPGGMRDPINNDFRTIGENGLWWTATAPNSTSAWSTYLWNQFAGVDHNAAPKRYGFSIRCIKDVNTDVGDIYKIDNFRLYPNPANDKITIDFAENQECNLRVYTITSEMVFQKVLTKKSNEIDISSLPKGVYLLKFTGNPMTKQLKLIKE